MSKKKINESEEELEKEIDRLFNEEKLSVKTIAKKMGIHYKKVTWIICGKPETTKDLGKERPKVSLPDPEANPVRCPICGHLVYPPCLACQLKEIVKNKKPKKINSK